MPLLELLLDIVCVMVILPLLSTTGLWDFWKEMVRPFPHFRSIGACLIIHPRHLVAE